MDSINRSIIYSIVEWIKFAASDTYILSLNLTGAFVVFKWIEFLDIHILSPHRKLFAYLTFVQVIFHYVFHNQIIYF